jgi:hypothetical protein
MQHTPTLSGYISFTIKSRSFQMTQDRTKRAEQGTAWLIQKDSQNPSVTREDPELITQMLFILVPPPPPLKKKKAAAS